MGPGKEANVSVHKTTNSRVHSFVSRRFGAEEPGNKATSPLLGSIIQSIFESIVQSIVQSMVQSRVQSPGFVPTLLIILLTYHLFPGSGWGRCFNKGTEQEHSKEQKP